MSNTHGSSSRPAHVLIVEEGRPAMSGAVRLQNYVLIYLCVWTIAPPLAYGDAYRIGALGAAVAWVLIELTRKGNILTSPTVPVLVCVAYLLYTIGVEASLGTASHMASHIEPALMLFFLVVYESRRGYVASLAPVFWWTLVTIPAWLTLSLLGLGQNEHAARIVVRSSAEAVELSEEGVGGYALTYFAVMLLPITLALTFAKRHSCLHTLPKFLRLVQFRIPLLSGATALLSVLFIVRAQYSIAIYLMLISFAAVMIRRERIFLLALFAIPVGVIALQGDSIPSVLEVASSVTQETNVGNKLQDIQSSMLSSSAVGTVHNRIERYERSIDLFLGSPVIGVLDMTDVGKHSSFLDRFARYGLFVGAAFMYLILYLPVRMLKRMKGAGFGMTFAVFTIAGLFPALNNVFMAFGTALYIMFPVACSFFRGGQGRAQLSPASPTARSIVPKSHPDRVVNE